MTNRLLALLIEFDEMGFSPTTVCEDPEGHAVKWKELLLEEIKALESDNVSLCNEADENAALSMENKMRADRLEKENANLRERLDKAVELPVKVGDPVYFLQYFCDYKGCGSTTQQFCCGCKEMIEREKRKEYYVIREKPFELKDLPKIGKKYFTTCDAAEARLAELNGGKK